MRLAVAGAGLIGRKHVELVSDRAELVAIIDPDPAAKQISDEKRAVWYREIAPCLAEQSLDGVIIATPNSLHVPMAMACLETGIPVLVEKPVAAESSQAQDLVDASARTGVPVLVGHHRRHSAIARKVRAVIDAGTLGRIVSITGRFLLYKPDEYFDATWRTQKGGGPVFINLIHDIDLIRYFCGDVRSVQAMESRSIRGFEVEDGAAILLGMESGALGTVCVSDTAVAPWSWEFTAGENPAYPNVPTSCYEICGTHGSLSVPDMMLWQHPGKRGWWEPIEGTRLDTDVIDPLVAQLDHFFAVIRREAAPLVSAYEGFRTLQVVEAIKAAADSGTAQELA